MDKLERWARVRIRFVAACFVLVFVLVAVRAFQLQVSGQDDWQKRAERQYQRVIPLIPQRGTIYDRNEQELALSLEADSVFAEPQKIGDPAGVARILATTLDLPLAQVSAKVTSRKGFVWIKRQISPAESAKVRAMGLAGVNFIKEHRRYYPSAEIGAQVIGFTGLDPEGLEGLELKYDSLLLGQGGYLVTERDALGRGIGGGGQSVEGASPGANLHLTLDKSLQYLAEKELAAGLESVRAKAGSVVLLDPASGRVLAMASNPGYNPNAVQNHQPSQWRNRALVDTFEPGSTFKIFLLAAALNEGVIRPGQGINCENGSYKVGGRVIHDHHPYGRLTPGEVLKYSSNIGSAKIGKALERERFYRYLRDFGFGVKSGIDLPGENGGLLRRPNQWFEADLAAISFGQGVTVTPLQLATATAAIANNGTMMKPYIVERVTDANGMVVEEHGPQMLRQVVSPQVAAAVREMMVAVTEKGGTGTLAAVPGFRVAGKTGTAQKVDPVTGGYSADKRVSSFVGFVPAEAPKLVALVIVDEPADQVYGGLVAAPIFSRIASQALQYLNVQATMPVPAQAFPEPQQVQAQKAEDVADGAEEIPVDNPASAPLMPNFAGLSSRQVLQQMTDNGLNIRLVGSGRVVDQGPPAGTPISYGSEAWVRLASPADEPLTTMQ
jgi:cell division protein FtsI (penicillin-binding protein 3)